MLRDLLLPLLLLTCAGSPAHASEASDDAPRPNLILFLVDDLGWRDHGLPEREGFGPNEGAGQERFHTPHLERLAERGLVFTDGYASAPVCTPTRTSIQTGMSPGQSHITYWTQYAGRDTSRKHPRLAPPAWRTDGLDADEVTLAKLLRDAGYRTIHVGKAHFGAKGSACEDPTAVGFVRNVAGHAAGAPGSFLSEHAFTASGRQGRQQHEPSYWDVPGLEAYHDSGTYLTEALAREAVSEIDEAVAAGEPFFLNFAPYAVHTPIMANPALLDERYAGLDPQEAAYATMIESVDDALGAIVAKLDELGIADETALFYTSDNGGLSAHARGRMPDDTGRHHHNAPLLSGKGSAYEGGIRVPWVVRWPGMEEELVGAISNQVIVSHDLFPTFLNLAGVKMPEEHAPKVEGMDIPGLIDQADLRGAPVARLVPWHQPHQWGANGPGIEPFTAVRHGAFKLILFHDGPRYELYDLARDPGEARDLFASRNHFGWRRALALATTAWALGREVQPSRSHGQASMTPPGPVDVADVQEAWYELTLRGPLRDTTPRPNILWITVDDLGWADLSGTASTLGHGSSLHKTPHTDRLAERGLAFPRAYAAAPNCAPSRASMWTGLWPARTGVYTVGEPNRGRAELRSLEAASNTTTLPDELLTITERLPRPYGSGSSSSLSGGSTSGYPGYPERPFGYQSIHLGKWHLGGGRGARTAPGDPLAQGFHDNIGGDARGNPGGVQFADDEGRFPLPGLERAGEPSQWIDDRLGDELLRVLERLTARAGDWVGDGRFPFFANLSLYAVHTPVRPTAEDRAAFDDARIPAGSRHDDLEYAAYVKGYDDVVGDVIAKLEELDDPRWPGHKLIENTIVVLTSDNGGFGGYEESGVPGLETYGAGPTDNWPLRGGKGQLYEGGIRVPLIIRWDAGLPVRDENGELDEALRARCRDLLISGVDLTPTLLGLAGVGDCSGMDGRDLSGYLRGRQPKHADQLFWHFPAYLEAGRKGMRTGPASLIRSEDFALHYVYEDRRVELYRDVDLATISADTPLEDLPERRDLAADPAHRPRAERMLHALATWLADTDAAMPTDPRTGQPVPLPSPADLPPLSR